MRIGHGYDVHALVAGRKLVLGGVTIAHALGLAGHSDADVLIHAICDACLGAAGLGDIGRHFPDADPRYKGIDSRALLRQVHDLIRARGWLVGNVDCTIVAQAPKLAPHLSAMAANLAVDLRVLPEQINIKATTTEKLGFAGREEGIAAHAVVLLVMA
jgi:2-C-methyl-D-erythritol 2,4-cyclodiphosphate synthase